MGGNILVAYASKYGSTRQVAGEIAATLNDYQLDADVIKVEEVKRLDPYDAVILGAPIYIGRWMKDAHRFLEDHREALATRPVAIFALGPISDLQAEMESACTHFKAELAKHPWLTPLATQMFVGKYDPNALRFPDRLLRTLPASPLKDLPATDNRDWRMIRTWAANVGIMMDEVMSPLVN